MSGKIIFLFADLILKFTKLEVKNINYILIQCLISTTDEKEWKNEESVWKWIKCKNELFFYL